jgi:TrmH family RNA methyltransferase
MASHKDVDVWASRIRDAVGTCRIVGADEKATVGISDYDFSGPTITIFGNEAHGLSRAYEELCDATVQIPIDGSATSLNVAVAASVMFYEISRQRRVTAPR